MELQNHDAFNESVAFSAGTSHERRRIADIIKCRLDVLKTLKHTPVKQEIVRNLTFELESLLTKLETE